MYLNYVRNTKPFAVLSLSPPSLDEYAKNIVLTTQGAYRGSAKRALPHRGGQPWWNEDCNLAVKRYKEARQEPNGLATDEAKRVLRRAIRQAKDSFFRKKLDDAATARDVFNIAN